MSAQVYLATHSGFISLLLQDNDYICNQLTSRYALAHILKVQVPHTSQLMFLTSHLTDHITAETTVTKLFLQSVLSCKHRLQDSTLDCSWRRESLFCLETHCELNPSAHWGCRAAQKKLRLVGWSLVGWETHWRGIWLYCSVIYLSQNSWYLKHFPSSTL